jgi:hypothetical protein
MKFYKFQLVGFNSWFLPHHHHWRSGYGWKKTDKEKPHWLRKR